MPQQENITIKLVGKDKFSKVFGSADKQLTGLRKRINQVGKASLVMGSALAVGIGAKAISAAAEFEKGMTNVATIVDTSTENMEEMGKKVKEIAKKVPVDIKDLTTALYNVRSAGISAGDAMKVLETSGKLAVAGLSTTEEAVDLLTSAINVYGDESHDAEQLADILFNTVKAGKTTVAELAQGFGKVAAIAKETGIGIEDLSAATAVLTTGGLKAAEAQTALKAMIANVLKPTADATEAAKKLGISFDLSALQAKGLSGMLKEISEKAGDDKQALADLFGSVEAANAIFTLASEEGGAAFNNILNEMTTGSGNLNTAFQKQNETTTNQYNLLKNNLNVAMMDLGVKILPPLIEAIKILPYWLEVIAEWWDEWTTALSKVFIWVDKVVKGLESIIQKGKEAAKYTGGIFSGGWRGDKNIKGIPFFAEGGVVPGPVGAPTPAIVHGGETIIPAGKSIGGNISITVTGNTFMGEEDFADKIADIIYKQLQLNAKI